MEKNCILNQSLTHPAYLMPREAKLSLQKIYVFCNFFVILVVFVCPCVVLHNNFKTTDRNDDLVLSVLAPRSDYILVPSDINL